MYAQTTLVLHSPPFFDQLSRLDGHYLTDRLRALQTLHHNTNLQTRIKNNQSVLSHGVTVENLIEQMQN